MLVLKDQNDIIDEDKISENSDVLSELKQTKMFQEEKAIDIESIQ